jgi:hypothetical protein
MTVPSFTVRDLTWRSYATAQPRHGDYVLVRINDHQHEAHYQHGAYGTWVLANGGKFRAHNRDEWRPEDER